MAVSDLLAGAGVVALVLALAGVVGWLGYLKLQHRDHYGLSDYGELDPDAAISCPDCGARNDAERETCRYCSEALGDGDDDSDRWGHHTRSERAE